MRSGYVLAGGMVAFAIAVSALVAWLIFGGVAGKERGLVFKNLTASEVVLKLDDGRVTPLGPGEEQTLPVKPAQFPQAFHVTDAAGSERYSQRFEFPEFKDFEFRIGIGDDKFIIVRRPTSN